MLRVCNACRYCEGFCAVFPAMERRLDFSEPDLNYLANLCHDCGECYYACQYVPPHEFMVDLPKMFSEIRVGTYRKYAWPEVAASLFCRSGIALVVSTVAAASLSVVAMLFLVRPSRLFSAHADAAGSFYSVVPHQVMVLIFGLLSAAVLGALTIGFLSFLRDVGETVGTFFSLKALRRGIADALRLRYLEGGGEGCAYPDAVPSSLRRRFHHLTFYGFLLCFAATTVGAIYHYVFHWHAPYPLLSAPVLLGIAGGLGLLVGPPGLLWLKALRSPELSGRKHAGMDVGFLVLLFVTSLTGFLLLAFRESASMGVLLGVHLGVVAGLFITLPYGKFVHAIYRAAALVRNAAEAERGGNPG